jgi:tRNA U34 5-methylaminomethyl-2-thiouridine-forming methyltransferase MnmC
MRRELVLTKDGSYTVAIPELQLTYHSKHGAVQESKHVFIQAGLMGLQQQQSVIQVFEMGLGTGLNALLTAEVALANQQAVYYTAVEAFPLQLQELEGLNYNLPNLDLLHHANWNEPILLNPFFTIVKQACTIQDFTSTGLFHLIYYDAFAPSAQPELWTEAIFLKLYNLLAPKGLLVTYCSKGQVRRNMQAAGFVVEKIPGPPGKREMVRAHKKEVYTSPFHSL